jgi:hypothetical protein
LASFEKSIKFEHLSNEYDEADFTTASISAPV